MFSISYGADEHYVTPNVAGVPTYENGKQFIATKRRLVNFYAFNSGPTDVFVCLADTANGAAFAAGDRVVLYPVPSLGFTSVAIHGGDRFERGIYAQAFTDPTMATPAGAVMLWKVDW